MDSLMAVSRPISGRDEAFERATAAEAIAADRRLQNLLDRYERRLRRVVFGMLGDPDRVDDVLQEAFLRAYRGLPAAFDNDRLEAAWLYRIVHRCCLNELRSRRRRPESPGIPDDSTFASHDHGLDSLVVAHALAELRPPARAVLLLVDVIGLDYETSAKALRIPAGTVASRLNKARAEMRAALRRAGVGDDA
jgi:RNA polymerase sigma-70 factor (ECF subfamily)